MYKFKFITDKLHIKFLFLLLFFFIEQIFAQNIPSYKILGISVEGNSSAEPSVIIASSGLKVNDEIQIPSDATINAIKRILALNIFSDVFF